MVAPPKGEQHLFLELLLLILLSPRPVVYCSLGLYHCGSQHVEIPRLSDWPTVLGLLHKGIGCEDTPLKPDLSFRLDKCGSKFFGLGSEVGWKYLVAEVEAEEAKQSKSKQLQVKVDIIVSDKVIQFTALHFM